MTVIKVNKFSEESQFWNAVEIYYKHPNSVNKQVLFSEDVLVAELHPCLSVIECNELFNNFCYGLKKNFNLNDCILSKEFSGLNVVKIGRLNNISSLPSKMFIIVRMLHSKIIVNDNVKFFEFIFLDKSTTKVFIFTKSILKNTEEGFSLVKTEVQNPYAVLKFNYLQLSWNMEFLKIHYNKDLEEKGLTWLHAIFSPKFMKLISSGDINKVKNKNINTGEVKSNIDTMQYYKLYNEMKLKYGKFFVQNWTENTDPKKFVYEDIGIATYLMMLWNGGKIPNKNSKKQRFVDLGCGNGLLVHILNSEGHIGIGLDIRKRKIWDIYPSTTVLKEETILPSCETTYSQTDWLIGNHSDELTAWIPIMARLSHSQCQYFVLPCCPYEINGKKFQRKNSSHSSYQDFINYVKKISLLCNFETSIDKLRIPSTKRICLVGLSKAEISEDEYISVKQSVIKFVSQELQLFTTADTANNTAGSLAPSDIKIRAYVEPVRNCTRLPSDIIDKILRTVMKELLKEQSITTLNINGESHNWNRGKKISIAELASLLNKNLLSQLKNECKGLQTLLKNHSFLFEVSQGYVQFRSPDSMTELSKKFSNNYKEKWKLKKCWLFNNHPDKCPLNDNVCSYNHSI